MKDIVRFCMQGWGFWRGWYWVLRFSYACVGIRVGRYLTSKLYPEDWAAYEKKWAGTLSAVAQGLYAFLLTEKEHPDFNFEYVRNVQKGIQALSRLSGVPILVNLPKDPHRLKPPAG